MLDDKKDALTELHELEVHIREVRKTRDWFMRMFEINNALLANIRDEIAVETRHLEYCERKKRELVKCIG